MLVKPKLDLRKKIGAQKNNWTSGNKELELTKKNLGLGKSKEKIAWIEKKDVTNFFSWPGKKLHFHSLDLELKTTKRKCASRKRKNSPPPFALIYE